jgi:hypothetical protein
MARIAAFIALASFAQAGDYSIHAGGAESITLSGPDATQQLLVTDGGRDVTREVEFTVSPTGVIEVSNRGLVTPLADGAATISAGAARISVTVEKSGQNPLISFRNDIVPILTRNECNTGGCHAKTGGQNGFHLSLFGYEPEADYHNLLHQSRGRRISLTAPSQSLILQKASGDRPHEGGARLAMGGRDYSAILRWIEQGLPFGAENEPLVERIEVFPRDRVLSPHSDQQLLVTAFMSDGSKRDITHNAQYEPNQEDMAEIEEGGLVRIEGKTGSTSVMIRFQEHVDVFRAIIPLGHETPPPPTPVNFVDERIFAQLNVLGLPPSERGDDAMFLRRVTIDIAGRLPTLEETQEFLESKAPDKRAKRIDALLETVEYADYFAGKWAAILRNKAQGNLDWVSRETYAFHGWLRQSFLENKPFSQLVAELLTASGKSDVNPAVGWYRVVQDPKDQMADIAQVFLGIRMQCAQCHHHPYEKWTQDDYYGFAAFFSTLARKEVYKLPESDMVYHKMVLAEYENPTTKEKLKPTPLEGVPLEIPEVHDPRVELANWMTSRENPYFAKMLVNRYWKHFFSRGLVEPEDDMRITNPATHPDLLDQLGQSFIDSGFDVKHLIRTICNSQAYQLSSEPNEHNSKDDQYYARYYPKRLPAEVMLDAINDIADSKNSFNKQPLGVRAIALPDDNANKESIFLTVFGRPQMDSACECERTADANLAQSLHLINSPTVQAKLSASKGRAAELAADTERPDEDRIHELYMRALAREADAEELAMAFAHLKKKRDQSAADPEKVPVATAEKQAFEDILWVVVNTKEFLFNR